MYSAEYLRDLETSAHLDRLDCKQKAIICPVCGRKYEKHWWRSPCCGVEMIWTEKKEGEKKMEDTKINMTNQEAIKALQEFALNYGLNNKMIDAFGKAIRALEEQPCNDCISRQAVIEWLKDKDIIKTKNQEENARRELAELPSVTPQTKVGHWIADVDRWGGIVTTVNGYRCSECNNFDTDRENYCPNCGARMEVEE